MDRAIAELARQCGWTEEDLDQYCRDYAPDADAISFRWAGRNIKKELYFGLLNLRGFKHWQRREQPDAVLSVFFL